MGPGETFRTPFCAINPEGACRACTGRHPTGNGHRAAMPRDERGIAVIGQGKESFPVRSINPEGACEVTKI